MKRLMVAVLVVVMGMCLCSCRSDGKNPPDTDHDKVSVADKEETSGNGGENASDNGEEGTPDGDSAEPSDEDKADRMVIDTKYYTVTLTDGWEKDCVYETIDEEDNTHFLAFYERTNHEGLYGGHLFTIGLFPQSVDVSVFPSYDVLGTLETKEEGSFQMIAMYPTDVQFSEDTYEKYNSMCQQIPDILGGIEYKDNCTFSPAQ